MISSEVSFYFIVLLLMHDPLHAVVGRLSIAESSKKAKVVFIDSLYFSFSAEVVQTSMEVRGCFRSVFALGC